MDRAATPADAASPLIRPWEPTDAPAISALLGRVGTFEGTLQMPDVALATRLDILQRVEPNDCKLVAVADGVVVGCAGLHSPSTSLRRKHVRSLGICLAVEWQGRGVGRQLIQRLLDWADNWAGVLRVELLVHADNDRAMALYRSMGFIDEGCHRGYAMKNGRYVDSYSMARMHPAPPDIAVRTAAG